ncbi:hypothetical protein C0995_000237, partial [Termitomyces sp. Mi166
VPKFVPKPIIALASSSAPKPAAATALSKPTPAKSAGPAVKGGFVFKDPFMKCQPPKELCIVKNLAMKMPNSDNGDVAMDVDSTRWPEETQPVAPTKTTVTEIEVLALAPVPVLLTKPKRTPFFKLHCTTKHIPFLPLGLQVPVQFEQNQPSVARWQNHVRGHYEV